MRNVSISDDADDEATDVSKKVLKQNTNFNLLFKRLSFVLSLKKNDQLLEKKGKKQKASIPKAFFVC